MPFSLIKTAVVASTIGVQIASVYESLMTATQYHTFAIPVCSDKIPELRISGLVLREFVPLQDLWRHLLVIEVRLVAHQAVYRHTVHLVLAETHSQCGFLEVYQSIIVFCHNVHLADRH